MITKIYKTGKRLSAGVFYLLLLSISPSLLVSCEDFLDTDNLTKKDTSNFTVNEKDAIQMVNGIYAVMNRNLADPEEDPFFVFDIASDDRLGGGSQSNIGAQGVDRLMNAYLDWMKPLWKQRYAGSWPWPRGPHFHLPLPQAWV